MPYPTRSQILAILRPLSSPPAGNNEFFAHVSDNVIWTVTGHMMLSGTWRTKESYRAATFAKIGPLFGAPGMKLEVPGGEQGIIAGEDGQAVAELKTVDTYTKSGVLYDQHYSWHMRFNEESVITEVKAFMDTAHLEKVLGAEMEKQKDG
jgi:ketosteroid isomerase-like protein